MFLFNPPPLISSAQCLVAALLLSGFTGQASAAQESTGQESTIVSLKDTVKTEVQARAFTLPKGMRVRVLAKGGGQRDGAFFAYGWILNAATREVVWQMSGRTAKAEGDFQVADQTLNLKAGTYEAYFSNHGFGASGAFFHGTRDIDRRKLGVAPEAPDRDRFGFRAIAEALVPGRIEDWKARAPQYGLEITVRSSEAGEVQTAPGPVSWRGEALALLADRDGGEWRRAFKTSRPVTLHIYCQGEKGHEERLADTGWIIDARTRKVVWEMDVTKADYAGGAEKNRRKVETLVLPAGEYLAAYTTDDSHSPAHWNAAPSCDPLRYGLILSLPKEADASAFAIVPEKEPGTVLAALVKVGSDRRQQVSFTLAAPGSVRVYALGEADGGEMADGAWITDVSGARVWAMTPKEGMHAGGAWKNRVQDQFLTLAAGTYTLHVRTDGSHAYGDWNDAPPRDTEHYGVTVYSTQK